MDDLIAFIRARVAEDETAARENGPHIARRDPLRAMREVEAMRRIVDLAAKAHEWTHSSAGATAGYAAAIIGDTLRALAVIWADHPDWRPEWCAECRDGLVSVGHCNCGSPADASIGYMHERLCGYEPCPRGCWDRLYPERQA